MNHKGDITYQHVGIVVNLLHVLCNIIAKFLETKRKVATYTKF